MKFTGENVRISPNAKVGKNVRIGDHSIIYDNVEIGDGSTIGNHCIIGEPTSDYYSTTDYLNSKTIIGTNALIRSHAIVYSDVHIGDNLETGHRITIREGSRIGHKCKIGTNSDLQGHLTIGDYCQLHSSVHICQHSKLGNYVFIYPYVVLTNDKYPPSEKVLGPTIGDYTQIGVHSVIMPAIKIGNDCLIGANSSVTRDFESHSFIVGNPAKRVSSAEEIKSDEGEAMYPWKNRFWRNMPWEA